MARFERLLIPIVLVVMLAAFLLEDLGPAGVRAVAITFGVLLTTALVVGMIQRARKKGRGVPDGQLPPAPDQTSNDDRPPAQPPA